MTTEWTTTYRTHDDCADCDLEVERAITTATVTGSIGSTSSTIGAGTVGHSATVTRAVTLTSTAIAVHGAKGGAGTTTFVAALALAHRGPVVIVGPDPDLPAVFGLASGEDERRVELTPTIWHFADADVLNESTLPEAFSSARLTIVVGGEDAALVADTCTTIVVIRPCYLSLRRWVRTGLPVDGIVFVDEPNRALGVRDVANVIGAPVFAAIEVSAAVARAIDAGVLPSRLPAALLHPAYAVLARCGVEPAAVAVS